MGQEFIPYLAQIVWCPHMFDAEPISSHPAAPCVANAGRANVQAGPAPGVHRISSDFRVFLGQWGFFIFLDRVYISHESLILP